MPRVPSPSARAGRTIFEASLLLWTKTVFYVMQGKRGMPAKELQRHLGVKLYGRVWGMLQQIRTALQQRDASYQVGDGVLELDAGTFGRRASGNQCDVLVAIETKPWVDAKGRLRSRAGFAKILVAKETKPHAQQLVDTGIRKGAMVKMGVRACAMWSEWISTIKWSPAIRKRVSDGSLGCISLFPMGKPG